MITMKKGEIEYYSRNCWNNKKVTIPVTLCELTNCMQMRIKTKGVDYFVFECGIDIVQNWVCSTTGICGRNLLDFAMNYINYRMQEHKVFNIEEIEMCDDPIYEDRQNNYLEDKNLVDGFTDIQY